MHDVIVVHFDELALKQGRRPYYERNLVFAVQNAVRDLGPAHIQAAHGRFVVGPGRAQIPIETLVERLRRVFGIHHLRVGIEVGIETSSLVDASVAAALRVKSEREIKTFRVRVRGNDRRTHRVRPLEAELGSAIAVATQWTVDLDAPDFVLTIELAAGRAFVLDRRVEGPGGLPYGTAGFGVALLSGGIDSPVAAWMMMSRGMRVGLVHFHARPYTTEEALTKVHRLAHALTRWQPSILGVTVGLADPVHRVLMEHTSAPLRTILTRRFMVRIACALGSQHGAQALITGDALAQVSSQTITNLAATDAATSLPILRPLVGMGKAEIIARARSIGTLEISESEGNDFCSQLAPKNPTASALLAEIDAAERTLPIGEMTQQAVESAIPFRVRFEDPSPTKPPA